MLLHLPLVFVVIYGLVLLDRGQPAGLVISLLLGLSGLLALGLHDYFLKKGREEFDHPGVKGHPGGHRPGFPVPVCGNDLLMGLRVRLISGDTRLETAKLFPMVFFGKGVYRGGNPFFFPKERVSPLI